MQIKWASCLILHYYNLTKRLKNEQKKYQNAPLCTAVSPCMSSFIMHGQKWLILFFLPPSLLLLLSYTVFCSGHSYHLWNHVWPWDSLGIHTAIRGGYEMVPKVQGTIHILRKHIFCFWGPLLCTYTMDRQWFPRKRPLGKTPEVGLEGSEGSLQVKDPSDPCNPPRGSFLGVFPWVIIDGP